MSITPNPSPTIQHQEAIANLPFVENRATADTAQTQGEELARHGARKRVLRHFAALRADRTLLRSHLVASRHRKNNLIDRVIPEILSVMFLSKDYSVDRRNQRLLWPVRCYPSN